MILLGSWYRYKKSRLSAIQTIFFWLRAACLPQDRENWN